MQFFTPAKHVKFEAVKLFGASDNIKDISLAYIDKDGGGPTREHTHAHNHLFTVVEGEAKIIMGDDYKILKKGESFLVNGGIPHSVWNNTEKRCVMLGVNLIN